MTANDLAMYIGVVIFGAVCGIGWMALVLATAKRSLDVPEPESEPHIWPLDGRL